MTEDENAPENQGEQAKYLLRRDCALVATVLSVDPTLLHLHGADPENPAVVWKKLADQSQKEEDMGEQIGPTKNVVQFKAERWQSMQKHVKMLVKISDELSIIGDPLDEQN